ncbi:MAG TPA: nuclear transport factor 2 family protein [Anaeromyxobacteraceae bacterium]|nr:nuclear transport factor 2 family protein [Anaeromyxobacteraceae bacterium]
MSHEIEVLEANEAFYRAFTARDVGAMDALWARRAPVACIHPGWDALQGLAEVLGSFHAILGSASAPRVHCTVAAAHVVGDTAFVTCHERVQGAMLVATNVFTLEDGAWRMVHHHSSLLPAPEVRAGPPEAELRS